MVNNLKFLKEIQKRVYNTKEHPQVTITYSQIANVLIIIGDYKTALDQFEEILSFLLFLHNLNFVCNSVGKRTLKTFFLLKNQISK